MIDHDKPRICKVLGVEVGEVFTIKGYPNREYRYAILHTDRKLHNYLEEPCRTTGTWIGNKIGANTLYWLIDHPESILRKPRFTQEEVAVLRHMASVGIVSIEKKSDTHLYWDCNNMGGVMVVPPDFLPNLHPGQSVRLEDVLGANS